VRWFTLIGDPAVTLTRDLLTSRRRILTGAGATIGVLLAGGLLGACATGTPASIVPAIAPQPTPDVQASVVAGVQATRGVMSSGSAGRADLSAQPAATASSTPVAVRAITKADVPGIVIGAGDFPRYSQSPADRPDTWNPDGTTFTRSLVSGLEEYLAGGRSVDQITTVFVTIFLTDSPGTAQRMVEKMGSIAPSDWKEFKASAVPGIGDEAQRLVGTAKTPGDRLMVAFRRGGTVGYVSMSGTVGGREQEDAAAMARLMDERITRVLAAPGVVRQNPLAATPRAPVPTATPVPLAKIGDAISTDAWRVTAVSTTRVGPVITWSKVGNTQRADGEWVAIDVEAINLTDTSAYFDTRDFVLHLPNGKQRHPDTISEFYTDMRHGGAATAADSINTRPGATTLCVLVFDVPVGMQGLNLSWQPGNRLINVG
jgi:hypothetical protein